MVDEHFYSEPGSLFSYDYRGQVDREAAKKCSASGRPPILKCVQWNIERGYKLSDIIEILSRHQADIICLQELDIGCERTECKNTVEETAKALKMNCFFVTEFVELYSPKRSRRLQGGGVHGNAILSRFDMDAAVIHHSHHPLDWEKNGIRLGEPKEGQRSILVANIKIPGLGSPIQCYCLHLEVFCGIVGRLKQFADVMKDAKMYIATQPHQLIFGDLNTMAHGIARLSPRFCRDHMRWSSIGFSETVWWQYHIFDAPVGNRLRPIRGISDADIQSLANDHFYDPFSMVKDTTLHGYSGLFKGKLDWMLMRGVHTLAKGMDNHDFKASDHKMLYAVIRPCSDTDERDLDHDIQKAYDDGRILISHTRHYVQSLLLTASILMFIFAATLSMFLKNIQ